MSLHLGIQLSSASGTWDEIRETALLVDELGYDSLWVSDHLRGSGDPQTSQLESWQLIGALGALTSRAKVGVLVSAVQFRHPAVLAKMAATLDHVTGGRAILGLGAGWLESEHEPYGIPFGTKRERGRRLAEAAALARSLFDEPRATLAGRYYTITDALAEPKPLQRRLPICIGGTGDRTVLPAVARHADLWNAHGAPDYLARKIVLLREHCAAARRDPARIAVSAAVRPLIVRDTPAEIDARYDAIVARGRARGRDDRFAVTGDADTVAKRLAEFWRVGVTGVIAQMQAPYDRQSIERLIGEVKARLLESVAA